MVEDFTRVAWTWLNGKSFGWTQMLHLVRLGQLVPPLAISVCISLVGLALCKLRFDFLPELCKMAQIFCGFFGLHFLEFIPLFIPWKH